MSMPSIQCIYEKLESAYTRQEFAQMMDCYGNAPCHLLIELQSKQLL